jgi:Ran GTPase-activating protein (RanGAP) involved in mRNA processing and transport
VNLDGFALPVKKLQGTDPVETLDLSGKKLGVASAVVIASLIGVNRALTKIDVSWNMFGSEGAKVFADALRVNGVLTSLNLSSNNLYSVTHIGFIKARQVQGSSFNEGDKVVYQGKEMIVSSAKNDIGDIHLTTLPDVSGLNALADALRVNGGLTSLELRGNQLGDKGWGAIFAAICSNKDSKIMSLDVAAESISPAGVKLIAEALHTSVTGALTVTNLLGNRLDAESAKLLAEVAKQKGISLCGIQRDKTTADFSRQNYKLPNAILLASDLSQAVVTGALTKLWLAENKLEEEGTKAICEALEQNTTLKVLYISGDRYGHSNIGGTAGAKHVAKMLGVNGGLTSLDLSRTQLCGLDRDGRGTYNAKGVTAIADALRVNGGLTVANLLGNHLDAESAKMLAEVAKQKGISLCGIQRDQTTADFSKQSLKLPDAILLASDLSHAVVTGGLTSINLSNNQLCGVWTDKYGSQHGTYTAEGITAITDAMRVNGGLTKLSLADNQLGEEGTKAICKALEQNTTLKELDISGDWAHSNTGGSAGAKHVAKMLRVNGGLTKIE